jgi:hypothetical protein
MAKQRSAALSPPDVDAEGAADETPPDGAPPQANVVETTTAPRNVEWRRDGLFMEATLSPFLASRNGSGRI